jgi:hypothetical protein
LDPRAAAIEPAPDIDQRAALRRQKLAIGAGVDSRLAACLLGFDRGHAELLAAIDGWLSSLEEAKA